MLTSPHYPRSNGKLELYHHTLKEQAIRPKNPLSLEDVRRVVSEFVEHYSTVHLQIAELLAVLGIEVNIARPHEFQAYSLRFSDLFRSLYLGDNHPEPPEPRRAETMPERSYSDSSSRFGGQFARARALTPFPNFFASMRRLQSKAASGSTGSRNGRQCCIGEKSSRSGPNTMQYVSHMDS